MYLFVYDVFLRHFLSVKVIMASIFQKCHEKLQANTILAQNNICMLWSGPQMNNKYGAFNYFDGVKWCRKTAHRMAYIVYIACDFLIPNILDCSHLCHNVLCINSDHIVLEPRYINNSRKCCVSSNICTGHGDFPNCRLDLQIL